MQQKGNIFPEGGSNVADNGIDINLGKNPTKMEIWEEYLHIKGIKSEEAAKSLMLKYQRTLNLSPRDVEIIKETMRGYGIPGY